MQNEKSMEVVRLEHISKKYEGRTILNRINKTFIKGCSVAFVGHNGCGKSTLLKILSGLVVPTAGKVEYSRPLLFHYVPERFSPTALTARKFLLRMGAMDGLKRHEVQRRIETLGDDFFLDELLDLPMRSLSKGSLQKIGVIQAFLRKPDVLLLDEPLSGQDTASQKVFIEKVNRLREQDVMIFMSCHEKKLVEAIAEEVYTIQNGNLTVCRPEYEKRYTLILEQDNGAKPAAGMVRYGRYYKLTAGEKDCDRMICNLLKNGWKLRGMYDEESN